MDRDQYENNVARLIEAIRTSGRLQREDHLTMARALLAILDDRGDFPVDAEEALVGAVAVVSFRGVVDARVPCESPIEEMLLDSFVSAGFSLETDGVRTFGTKGDLL